MALTVLVVLSALVALVIVALIRGSSPHRRARSTTHPHDWAGSSFTTFGDGATDCGASDGGGGGSD